MANLASPGPSWWCSPGAVQGVWVAKPPPVLGVPAVPRPPGVAMAWGARCWHQEAGGAPTALHQGRWVALDGTVVALGGSSVSLDGSTASNGGKESLKAAPSSSRDPSSIPWGLPVPLRSSTQSHREAEIALAALTPRAKHTARTHLPGKSFSVGDPTWGAGLGSGLGAENPKGKRSQLRQDVCRRAAAQSGSIPCHGGLKLGKLDGLRFQPRSASPGHTKSSIGWRGPRSISAFEARNKTLKFCRRRLALRGEGGVQLTGVPLGSQG